MATLVFYIILMSILSFVFVMSYISEVRRPTKFTTDVLIYLDGSLDEAERELKNFFSQSIWYDMTETRYIFLFNISSSDEVAELCKKYEKKYPNIKIWE